MILTDSFTNLHPNISIYKAAQKSDEKTTE